MKMFTPEIPGYCPEFNLASVPVAVRWTIGDVSDAGFDALRLSVWGARRVFGPDAWLVICVNNVPLREARARTGPLPKGVGWQDATGMVPNFIRPHLDQGMADGVGWKFAGLRLFPQRYEISLENDCILWSMPPSIRRWLEERSGECLVAEDMRPYYGQFTDLCGPEPRNTGIRGLPPGYDFARALKQVLAARPVVMASEWDEQGLEIAALGLDVPPAVVTADEVSTCSPFPPHLPHLGSCGAHFVGLNARSFPWQYDGRPAVEVRRDHWRGLREEVSELVMKGGAAVPSPISEVQGSANEEVSLFGPRDFEAAGWARAVAG